VRKREKERKSSRISFSVVYIENVDLRLNQIKEFFSLFLYFAMPQRNAKEEEEERRETGNRRRGGRQQFYYFIMSRELYCAVM
jgi:hypothetical protein